MAQQNMKQHKLGWIGIGRMGYAMAQRLADAGCDIAVWNRTKEKREATQALAEKRSVPSGLWQKCDDCGAILESSKVNAALRRRNAFRSRDEVRQSFDRLINKFLHPPLEALRDESREGVPHGLIDAFKRLFNLKD